MDINCYALEVIAKTRLAELRAEAARRAVLASLRPPERSIWAALRCVLQRRGGRISRRGIMSARSA